VHDARHERRRSRHLRQVKDRWASPRCGLRFPSISHVWFPERASASGSDCLLRAGDYAERVVHDLVGAVAWHHLVEVI
jgi:hypothetical protein